MLRIAPRITHHRIGRGVVAAGACLVAALGALAACSQVLGFKDPTLEQAGPAIDAASTDTAVAIDAAIEIDAATTAIDAAVDASMAIDASIDAVPACVPSACSFGCDPGTNACRDGNLFIFKTAAAFFGSEFGGGDVPPNVRGGADGKCLETYALVYPTRACTSNHVHAILHVNTTDSIPLMATKYGIPTSAPIHRAEDDVLISNNWGDLIDATKQLRAPATTAASDADGLVWTGASTAATCMNWTSSASAAMGSRGYTNRMEAGWLGEDTSRCDRAASLLCICWSDGQ